MTLEGAMQIRPVSLLIGQVTLKHCFREANSVAHKLARVRFTNIPVFWDRDHSSFIILDVMNDVFLFKVK
jgi:hypothetical protein